MLHDALQGIYIDCMIALPPSVSVIIPVLNEYESIPRAINSAWLAGANEVIAVDGGSTDGTLELLPGLNCQFVSSKPGRGTQIRLGAEQSRGDILFFVHADAVLHRDCITQIIDAMSVRQPATHGCFKQRIDKAGLAYRMIERGNTLRAKFFRMMYGDQGIFVRRDIYEQIDGVPDVQLMEDVIFSDRLKKIGRPKILQGPIVVNARRWQKRGPVRQTLFNWKLYWRFRFGSSPEEIAQSYR